MRVHIEIKTGKDIVQQLDKSLKSRKLNFQKLAEMAKIGRSHLSQILNGGRACSRMTWERLKPYLTYEERQILSIAPRGTIVPPETQPESQP